MRAVFIVFSIITLLQPVFGQLTKDFKLTSCENLVVIGNFPVKIIQSDKKIATLNQTDYQTSLNNFSLSYSKDVLTVKYSGSFVGEIGIELIIYYPEFIPYIEARRGARVIVEDAGEFDSTASYKSDSGGKLEVNNVNSPRIKAEVTKGGSISINGETPVFEPTIKTGGTIASVNLLSKEVKAEITMGGEIICAPIENLDALITSGGTISYTGNPKVIQKIRIGGTIEKL